MSSLPCPVATFLSAPSVAALALVFASLGSARPAAAQWTRTTSTAAAPPVSIAAPDEPLALGANPGALGHVPAFGLRYTHVEARERANFAGAGDALHLVTPLFFGLAAGVSVESVRPRDATGLADRGVGAFGLGFAPSDRFGAGFAMRYFGSDDPSVDDLATLDAGFSWRPSSVLAFGLVGHDVFGPLHLSGDRAVASTYVFATAIRPSGTRHATFEGAIALDTEGRVGLRGLVELAVPAVGRLQALAEWNDTGAAHDLRATFGLAVDYAGIGLGGGVIVGEGLGGGLAGYGTARLEGVARPGIPPRSYVRALEVSSLDERRLLRLVLELEQVERDPRVAGLLLKMRGSDLGLAYAQEIRPFIERLVASGRPVVCHLDAGTGSELYACAGASATFIDPAGGVRLVGPSATTLLLGETLERIGLDADFVRIGRFKSAAEQYENTASSGPARAQRAELLDDVYERFLVDLSRDYDRAREDVQRLVDEGPYLTGEAVEAGVATGAADELDMEAALEPYFGDAPQRDRRPNELPVRWTTSARIGVVVVDGSIADGENFDVPFLGMHDSGGRTIAEVIDRFARDGSIRAIVLRVDSPGGSVLASDQIWRAVRRARERKPVVASMGAVAASGGYYVSSAANEIWAEPSTVTGSIGVFFGKVDVRALAQKLGVVIETAERGRRAGVESLYRPFTPDERAMLVRKLRSWYRAFLRRVHEGRGMPIEQVDALARGRVYSGDRAHRLGLVDHLGGFHHALARARELAGVTADAEVVVEPRRPETLLDYVLGPSGTAEVPSRARVDVELPSAPASILGAAFAIARGSSFVPQAALLEIPRLE